MSCVTLGLTMAWPKVYRNGNHVIPIQLKNINQIKDPTKLRANIQRSTGALIQKENLTLTETMVSVSRQNSNDLIAFFRTICRHGGILWRRPALDARCLLAAPSPPPASPSGPAP